jgi:hypothetical protein
MHPSRLKTFVAAILGAMSSGNCQQYSLSRMLNSPTAKSAIRRIERLFQKQDLTCTSLATFLVEALNYTGLFDLCLDRSNWEFGEKHINYLVLSWRVSKELSLPLFFVELDKAGNSNTQERINLIQPFIDLFGQGRIKSLSGDREFVGKVWSDYLVRNKIPFYMRHRVNIKIPYGEEIERCVGDFFDHLNVNQTRTLYKKMYGQEVCFVGKRLKNDELLIILTNQTRKKEADIFYEYRKRWSIEELFKKLKTSGFHWENTHMKRPERLSKLLIILSIAVLWSYLMGAALKRTYKKTLDCFVKTIFRYGLQNFQHLISRSIQQAIDTLVERLNDAVELVFQKSDG